MESLIWEGMASPGLFSPTLPSRRSLHRKQQKNLNPNETLADHAMHPLHY